MLWNWIYWIYSYIHMHQNFTKKYEEKNPAYGRHWLSRRVWIIALCQKSKQNNWVQFGTPPYFKALHGDNPWVKHLLSVDDPRVQSETTAF